MSWLATETADGAHVIPVGDAIEHDKTDDCVCGPSFERVGRDQGGDGWLAIHHSVDGRELTE
jgi:hypothetical protein